MNVSRHTLASIAAVSLAAIAFYTATAAPGSYEVTISGEGGPTPHSADHARAQARGATEELPLTF